MVIRVLQVINWFRRGGVETQLLQILQNYDRTHFRMDVCCFGQETGYLVSEAKRRGAKIWHCPKSIDFYSFSRRFSQILDERPYDIVHCHSEAWSGPVLRAAEHSGVGTRIAHIRSSVPSGSGLEGTFLKYGRYFLTLWGRFWLVKHSTYVLAVSAASLRSRLPRQRRSRGSGVWSLGVDIERFSLSEKKDYNIFHRPILINVGSFGLFRRQDLVLRIFRIIVGEIPDACLIFAGEGIKMESCRALAQALGIGNRVVFLGLRNDIPNLLRMADIFLSCSEVEGLPNSILEAQAAGLPVVASDIMPHREALCSEAHPFLFHHNQLRFAASNVLHILSDSKLYLNLRESGRANVCARYDAKENLPKLEKMYHKWAADCQKMR